VGCRRSRRSFSGDGGRSIRGEALTGLVEEDFSCSRLSSSSRIRLRDLRYDLMIVLEGLDDEW
jgi:hypothetical protein